MEDNPIDPIEILQSILNNIVDQSDSKEELIKMWFYIGRMMGIEKVFPEMQVVVIEDDEEKRQPILLVGTLHPLIVDYLTGENIITEDIAKLCLKEIKNIERDEVIH